jgi:hypothetical protein
MSMIDYEEQPEPEPVKPDKEEVLKALEIIRTFITNS